MVFALDRHSGDIEHMFQLHQSIFFKCLWGTNWDQDSVDPSMVTPDFSITEEFQPVSDLKIGFVPGTIECFFSDTYEKIGIEIISSSDLSLLNTAKNFNEEENQLTLSTHCPVVMNGTRAYFIDSQRLNRLPVCYFFEVQAIGSDQLRIKFFPALPKILSFSDEGYSTGININDFLVKIYLPTSTRLSFQENIIQTGVMSDNGYVEYFQDILETRSQPDKVWQKFLFSDGYSYGASSGESKFSLAPPNRSCTIL